MKRTAVILTAGCAIVLAMTAQQAQAQMVRKIEIGYKLDLSATGSKSKGTTTVKTLAGAVLGTMPTDKISLDPGSYTLLFTPVAGDKTDNGFSALLMFSGSTYTAYNQNPVTITLKSGEPWAEWSGGNLYGATPDPKTLAVVINNKASETKAVGKPFVIIQVPKS